MVRKARIRLTSTDYNKLEEVCEELKERDMTKNIPVIILSARASMEDKLKAMDKGVDDYIVKPFDPRELKARIKMRLKPSY